MIKTFHHVAYRCRDSEETRAFYEDFLGLPLVNALVLTQTKTGRQAEFLHTFFALEDGSCLAFFEVPDEPFEFKSQSDLDLHVAMEVAPATLMAMKEKGERCGIETRGVSNHGFVDSVYFRDPNGYVVELTAKRSNHDDAMDPARNGARATLDRWQRLVHATAADGTDG